METIGIDCGQLVKAMAKIETEVRDGLTHGHFEITITCSLGNRSVRDLIVKAGKSYRFRIAVEELETAN